MLRERYDRRPFVEEEPWLGKTAQVFDDHPEGLGIRRLAAAAGLTVPRVERALAWQNEQVALWCGARR